MTWTSGESIVASRIVDRNDRDQVSGHISMYGDMSMMSPHRMRTSFIGGFGDNYTIVQGTWTAGNNANQTDWDDILVSDGPQGNTTFNDLDEIKWSDIILNAGSYTIKISTMQNNACGILELLHGTTSIGTSDLYNATVLYNQIVTFTYAPTARTMADFRLRANGKNASSIAYFIPFSRLEIFRTA